MSTADQRLDRAAASADVLKTIIDLRKELADAKTDLDHLAWSAGTERRQTNDTIEGQRVIINTLSASVTSLQERLTAALTECDQHRADFVKTAEQAITAQVRVRELEVALEGAGR
jgi:hypothetical protein